MSSKAITDRPQEQPPHKDRPPIPENEEAPSLLSEDQANVARMFGMFGAALVIFGGMALIFTFSGKLAGRVSIGWASFALCVGLAGMLFHAAYDNDLMIRRLYLWVSGLCLLLGLGLFVYTFIQHVRKEEIPTGYFLAGFLWSGVALIFGVASLRHETDAQFRRIADLIILGVGGVVLAIALIVSNVSGNFLVPFGLLLALLGVMYLATFVQVRGISDDTAYYAGVLLGVAGGVVFLVALVRSLFPVLFEGLEWDPQYFLPVGLLLGILGVLCVAVSFLLTSDLTLIVLTRRELAAFFYSPTSYLVLLGFSIFAWFTYWNFLSTLLPDPRFSPPMEPIVGSYFTSILPLFVNVFVVPIITMRLLSEEHRSGTLEVLLTAPVSETLVVFSKFLAALTMFMLVWLPMGLYLIAIPLSGGDPFDYRPILSFALNLVITGAGFVAVGLLFSSLSGNQLASGVLTFAVMLGLTCVALAAIFSARGSTLQQFFLHMSYYHHWTETANGKVIPRNLLFFASLAIMGLFATIKVLESRKWR